MLNKIKLLTVVQIVFSSILFAQGPAYTTTNPGSLNLPPNPQITSNLTGPVLTTDWCANLAFNPNNSTQPLYADPLVFTCNTSGVLVGKMGKPAGSGGSYFSSRTSDLTVSSIGMPASKPLMDAYSDWSVTASWNNGAFKAVMAHGSPFVYFTSNNGIQINASASVFYNSGNVLGVTIGGTNYAFFAPSGSTWSVGGSIQSTLNGQNYCSVAHLPDNSASTVTYFEQFAHNHITNTITDWVYDEANATVNVTYTAQIDQKEPGTSNVLYALYPHQWLYYQGATQSFNYWSARGEMKVVEAPSFTTVQPYYGVLPHLTLNAIEGLDGYSEAQLRALVTDEYVKNDGSLVLANEDTYGTGVTMGRTAQLVRIANQLGMTNERDRFLNLLKIRIEDWLTYTSGESAEYFYYDERWGTLIGVKASYGSDGSLNDHHFHYGYYIRAAATIAMFDTDWATTWGDRVELLIRDVNAWDRNDPLFPFLRGFDVYAGHSWASGDANFVDGNNQESSSEALNCAAGIALWGMATNNNTLRDLGIFLYSVEQVAVQNYWFDVNKIVFPTEYTHDVVGMVWSNKVDYGTWFGGAPNYPEFILGINILPVTAASIHFSRYPNEIIECYDEMLSYGPVNDWQDVLWEFLAMADPAQAVSLLNSSNFNYSMAGSPDNETKAHTYHFIHNFNALGSVLEITANTPSYSVFQKGGTRTYIVYNEEFTAKTVTFSDGQVVTVPARTLFSTSDGNTDVPATGVSVSPAIALIAPGATLQLSATVLPVYATNQVVTWSTSDPSVATVDANGLVTGIANGNVSITATTDDGGFTASCDLTVSDAPTGVPIPALVQAEDYTNMSGIQTETTSDVGGGLNVGWIETGDWMEYEIYVPSTGTYNVDYRVASMTSGGQFTLLSNGTDLQTISFPATGDWQAWTTVSGEVTLTEGNQFIRITADMAGWNINWLEFTSGEPGVPVTGVSVTPTTVSVDEGSTTQLTATVSPSNATNQNVSWSSDNNAIATVNSNGTVTGVSAGTATVTVTTADGGFTATSTVTVNAVIVPVTGVSVTPISASLQVGETTQLTASVSPTNATDQSVSWSSDNTSVATVNSSGLVTAVSAGSATITVTTVDGGFTATSDITVTSEPITGVEIPALIQAEDYTDMSGIQLEGTADVGGGQNVGWIEAGDWLEYEIYVPTAGLYTVDYRVASLSAGGGFTLSSEGADLHSVSFSATGGWQNWITVSGDVSLAAGNHTIRITADLTGWNINWLEFIFAPLDVPVTGVSVTPTTASIDEGSTTQLTASVSPSNATNQSVSWSSSNSAIATVNSSGVVTGIASGTAIITVTTADGGYIATSSVTVNSVIVPVTGVSVSPTSETLQIGETTQLSASVSPSNATNQSISWSSDNVAVAIVSSSGLVTAISEGAAIITVTTADGGFTATANITVLAPGGDCIVSSLYGDYTAEVSNDASNPTITFVPAYTGVGNNIVILYYKVGNVGTFPGYIVQPNVPYQINASAGSNVYFYYTYSLPTGGERNTSSARHDFIVGDCNTLKASEAEETELSMNVYPNPVSTTLNIELPGNTDISSVEIFNYSGMLVRTLTNIQENMSVDVSELVSGMYLLKVSGNEFNKVTNFIKE